MAEWTRWWIERWLEGRATYLPIYLSVYLSIYLSICLPVYLSIGLSVYLSNCLTVYLSICLSICLSACLSVCLSVYLSICLSVCLSTCLSVYLSICLSVHLSIYPSIYPSIFLSIYLSTCLSICPSICPSMCLSLSLSLYPSIYPSIYRSIYLPTYLSTSWKFENLQHQKRSYSARPPSKMESWVQRWRPRTMRFVFFALHLCKVLSRKSEARSYEVQHLSFYIILANLQIWCSKMQSFSGNQRPDLLTSLMNFAHFWQGAQSLAPATQNDVWTSKSAPNPSVFYTFDFEMCFASQRRALFRHHNFQKRSGAEVFCAFWLRSVLRAQRRALFRHLNFQKWSGPSVLCAFWLRNVLRATTACTFSTSQPLKVLRSWGVLCILTWKRASRHNSMQLFISHLASWLRTRRFSEPTFRPSGATNHWKNAVFHDFPTFFAHLDLLSSGFFSSLTLPISAFHLSILSEVWLLNFLRW